MCAYGQTGSGKSYTMEGSSENPGILPRAISKLFDGSRADQGWGFQYKVWAVEFLNDKLEDLLVDGAEKVD